MPAEEDDDVYDGDYDFVDDEIDEDAEETVDEEDDVAEEPADGASIRAGARRDEEPAEEAAEEYVQPAPAANYVVHVYEYQKFKRTVDRPFTAEDAEAFASEYNRTAKPYGRFALAGKDDAKPKKSLD